MEMGGHDARRRKRTVRDHVRWEKDVCLLRPGWMDGGLSRERERTKNHSSLREYRGGGGPSVRFQGDGESAMAWPDVRLR